MTKLFRNVAPVALALMLMAPSAVLAQKPAPPGPPAQGAPGLLGLYKEAGASQEQLDKIAAASKDFEGMARDGQKHLMQIQMRMDALTLQPLPDEKAVLQNQEELNRLISDLNIARAKMMIKARTILTPDQRLKLVDIIKKHRAGQHGGG